MNNQSAESLRAAGELNSPPSKLFCLNSINLAVGNNVASSNVFKVGEKVHSNIGDVKVQNHLVQRNLNNRMRRSLIPNVAGETAGNFGGMDQCEMPPELVP